MKKIYSKIINDKLLHIVYRFSNSEGRQDLIPQDNFLQLASLSLSKGVKFRPHEHIWRTHSTEQSIAQESWVVIKGKVKFYFFDVDRVLLGTEILESGDCSITLEGGHTYEVLEDALVYEYKTGPYRGIEMDKVFLDD